MSWSKWIIVSFVLFGVFIGTLVAVCVKQDVNLVSKTYYQEELAYQQQMDRVKNANDLIVKPEIILDGNHLKIVFAHLNNIQRGKIKLFRPSDSSLDQTFELKSTSDTSLHYEVGTLLTGKYRAQMTWIMDGKEYYMEKVINI